MYRKAVDQTNKVVEKELKNRCHGCDACGVRDQTLMRHYRSDVRIFGNVRDATQFTKLKIDN